MINEVRLEGTVCVAPVFRMTKTGSRVCTVQLAVHHPSRSGGKGWTSYIGVEAWDDLAESVNALERENAVRVTGLLRQDRWEDETGKKGSRVKVVATACEPCLVSA